MVWIFLFFIYSILLAGLSSVAAVSRGHSGYEGFFLGIVFGIFALTAYLVIGETTECKARKQFALERHVERLRAAASKEELPPGHVG